MARTDIDQAIYADRVRWCGVRVQPARAPDVARGDPDDPHMLRWHIIPRNRFLNIYLNRMFRDDDDRALHDHPWWSVSFMLSGVLTEVLQGNKARVIRPGDVVVRSARMAHRLIISGAPAATLFITGPKIRSWGFHCPRGWVPWWDFDWDDPGQIGRGCGEMDIDEGGGDAPIRQAIADGDSGTLARLPADDLNSRDRSE